MASTKIILKTCIDCNKESAMYSRASRCLECREIHERMMRKKWKEEHREHVREYQARKGRTLPRRYKTLLDNAKKRNRECNISYEQFIRLMRLPCHYCGGYFEPNLLNCGGTRLDRKDNQLGYLLSNVAVACDHCNRFKGDLLSQDEAEYLIKKKIEYTEAKKSGYINSVDDLLCVSEESSEPAMFWDTETLTV